MGVESARKGCSFPGKRSGPRRTPKDWSTRGLNFRSSKNGFFCAKATPRSAVRHKWNARVGVEATRTSTSSEGRSIATSASRMASTSAVAMADRVSLESLFRARGISNEPRPRRFARRSLLPRAAPATRAARGASASAVRWRAVQTPTTSVFDAAARGGIATASLATSRGASAERRHRGRWGGRETTSVSSRASGVRRRREDPRRSLVRVPAYVGDGTGPEPEIIVAGDGAAIVLEDEEAKSRKLGWDFALSRVTLLQLATCAATGVAEPLLGTIDAYWVATLGTTALASLGPNTAVYSSVIAVVAAHGFGTAATRVMAVALENDDRARRDGELKPGDKTGAGANIIAVTRTAVAFGVLCALFIIIFPTFVVNCVGVAPEVVAPASGYMRARAFGVPAVCLIAVLGGAFQAARDAKTPLMAVMLAGSTNLVLDPSFIFLFKMGFQGAAYATVVAQYAEAGLMWWFAFKGPRRVNFFGGERIENETCLEKDDDPSSAAGTDGKTISRNSDVSDDTEEVCDPASYVFDKDLAWKFFREATSMLGRVANVVAVWAGTSALAARIGVYSGAAHVLLFQIICIISIAAGALTTVSNAVASRLQVSEGDSAASGAGAALSLLGVAIFAVICSVFWGIRVPLLTNFTPDTRVVEAALRSYPVVMMCVLTYFYKALEGALIGRGDAKSVNAVFALGGIVCAASLAWFKTRGPLTLQGVWCSLFLYYVALTAGMLTRWVQLDRGGVPVGGRTFKTTPAAPIAVEDDA